MTYMLPCKIIVENIYMKILSGYAANNAKPIEQKPMTKHWTCTQDVLNVFFTMGQFSTEVW